MDYRKAGVNIDAGNAVVKAIGSVVAQTARAGADARLGGFGSIFDLKAVNYRDPLLISGTDGVGTKLKLAVELNKHDTIGQDLVAMCVNDIVSQGAEPLFFLDYLATSKLDPDQAATIISGIADGCTKAGCALIGGETAELPGVYQNSEYDLAGFAVGIVERDQLLPKKEQIVPGDVVIGLASSGIHSNGFSLVRKIIADNGISLHEPAPFPSTHKSFGELLLEPTLIYTTGVLPLIKKGLVKGIAHITGGGLLENIPRILPENVSVQLDRSQWDTPAVFNWLQETGKIAEHEMQRVFNLGIGMVMIVSPEHERKLRQQLVDYAYSCFTIGTVSPRATTATQIMF